MEFHFIRPQCLWLGLALLPLLWLSWRRVQANQHWRDVCDAHLLPYVTVILGQSSQRVALGLFAAAWTIAVIAMAGPSWVKIDVPSYQSARPVVLVLDLSLAMSVEDIKPNRLARAQYKIRDLLSKDRELQVGMVAFAKEAYVVSPVTSDGQTLVAMLPELNPSIMPVQGSDIAAGLALGSELLKRAESQKGDVILLTASSVTEKDRDAARQLATDGRRLLVLGVATPQGSPIATAQGFLQDGQGNVILSQLDSVGFSVLAKAGNGQYFAYTHDDSDVDAMIHAIQQPLSAAVEQTTAQQITQWKDQGRYLILLLLVLFCYFSRQTQ